MKKKQSVAAPSGRWIEPVLGRPMSDDVTRRLIVGTTGAGKTNTVEALRALEYKVLEMAHFEKGVSGENQDVALEIVTGGLPQGSVRLGNGRRVVGSADRWIFKLNHQGTFL